jgi:hypothetical protein
MGDSRAPPGRLVAVVTLRERVFGAKRAEAGSETWLPEAGSARMHRGTGGRQTREEGIDDLPVHLSVRHVVPLRRESD